jgi:phosphate transport system protein
MNGYEQRLATDKAEIRRRVCEVGGKVHDAVAQAVSALLEQDRQAAYLTVLGDLPINREIRAINKRCHAFIARHLPSAGHLRFVSAVLQIDVALERIGDYAATISREATVLSTPPPAALAEDLRSFSEQTLGILHDALLAFSEKDIELARKTRPKAKSASRTYSDVYADLSREGAGLPISDAFALLAIFHRVERVADQAKNISEETLFELTGETKAPKQYRVLFVDDDGTTLAPLAKALARKAFPESGHYSSASCEPSGQPSPELVSLADQLALDLSGTRPATLPPVAELVRFDVVVALTKSGAARIGRVPYGTVLLEWPLDLPKNGASLEEVSKRLSLEVHDLMVLMRGDDAR